jgi:hypothetical protein
LYVGAAVERVQALSVLSDCAPPTPTVFVSVHLRRDRIDRISVAYLHRCARARDVTVAAVLLLTRSNS